LQNYRNEKTLNPNFKGEKFSSKELENFKNICKKYVKNIEVRK
jgi:hypothetical protein